MELLVPLCMIVAFIIGRLIIGRQGQAIDRERTLAWSKMADHLGLVMSHYREDGKHILQLEGKFHDRPAVCVYTPGEDYDPSRIDMALSLNAHPSLELSLSYRTRYKLFSLRQILSREPRVPKIDATLEDKFSINFRPDAFGPAFFGWDGIRRRLTEFKGPIEIELFRSRLRAELFGMDAEPEITPYFDLLNAIGDAVEAISSEPQIL